MNLLGMKEFEHIITWSDCGTMFTIHNPKNFVSEVLPQYFKQAKFTSFLRKVRAKLSFFQFPFVFVA